jgi:hypothetical protein
MSVIARPSDAQEGIKAEAQETRAIVTCPLRRELACAITLRPARVGHQLVGNHSRPPARNNIARAS